MLLLVAFPAGRTSVLGGAGAGGAAKGQLGLGGSSVAAPARELWASAVRGSGPGLPFSGGIVWL